MIKTKEDLRNYLETELAFFKHKWLIHIPFEYDEQQIIAKYIYRLRKTEYHVNCNHKIMKKISRLRLQRMQNKYGMRIPINVFDVGLSIAHAGDILVNGKAKVGKNCRIHLGVVIGDSNGGVPTLGDDIYIAPGAKIFGDIYIADNIMIGANAVVNKTCEDKGGILVGVPASVKGNRF